MICYYHRDLDGMCSGFWVALLADKHDIYRDRYIECDYRKKTPVEMVKPGEQVFIVDCSIDPKEMESMFNVTTDITWIDHHQSAIDKYWDFPIEIAGVRKEGIAACMLTFCYLKDLRIKAEKIHGWVYSSFLDLKDDAPYFTALIADYDTFKFKYGMDTRYFQLGASSLDL
jgi:oligoribonuclease NrnB/cAMP/cGMP phosphodiesterase (DHH superfamily)